MDPRHETLAQEISNELIISMNKYIQENLDEVLLDQELCENMQLIGQLLYFHADMQIDIEQIISKKNFLSLYTVFLPLIEQTPLLTKKSLIDLSQLLDQIALIAESNLESDNAEFYENILKCLSRHKQSA